MDKAFLTQRIESHRKAIADHEVNLMHFQNGQAKPQVGEVKANELILARKRRELSLMVGQLNALSASIN